MLVIYTILILSGIAALSQLPVELYPNISFGEISIIIEVRGGIPPTEVEARVSKPIEEAVGSVSHLEEMMSISKEGESTVVLSFEPGINMDFAALEVREVGGDEFLAGIGADHPAHALGDNLHGRRADQFGCPCDGEENNFA